MIRVSTVRTYAHFEFVRYVAVTSRCKRVASVRAQRLCPPATRAWSSYVLSFLLCSAALYLTNTLPQVQYGAAVVKTGCGHCSGGGGTPSCWFGAPTLAAAHRRRLGCPTRPSVTPCCLSMWRPLRGSRFSHTVVSLLFVALALLSHDHTGCRAATQSGSAGQRETNTCQSGSTIVSSFALFWWSAAVPDVTTTAGLER